MNKFPRPLTSVLAVHFALMAWSPSAQSADATVADLTQAVNTVTLGLIGASKNVAKAQEYSGLNGKSAQGALDLDLSGGGAYDSDSAARWSLIGRDLGLGSPSIALDGGVQGFFRFRANYDELLRRKDDSFQTPYLGVGGSVFSLPSTWQIPQVRAGAAGTPANNLRGLSADVTNSPVLVTTGTGTAATIAAVAPSPAQVSAATAIQAADLPLFRNYEIRTKRESNGLGMEIQFGRNWTASARLAQEHRSGLKVLSAISAATGGDNAAALPTQVDDDTETAHLGMTYVDDKLVIDGGYDGSTYTNNVKSTTWNLWNGTATVQTMSTAPSNESHKVYATLSYAITPMWKIAGNVSYGRGTQNDPFLTDSSTKLVPAGSLNGSVTTQQAGLKLTAKPIKDVSVTAAFKHDQRENHTPVNTYLFYDVGNVPPSPIAATALSPFSALFPSVTGGVNTNINIYANRPYSKKTDTGSITADYQINPNNKLSAEVEQQTSDRYCLGSWIDCSPAPHSTDTSAHLNWLGSPTDSLTARVSLSTSKRDVKAYNENSFLAETPMANQTPSTASVANGAAGSTAWSAMQQLMVNGWGPNSGIFPQPGAAALPTASLTALQKLSAFYFGSTVTGANTVLLNNVLSNALYGSRNRISELPGLQRYNLSNRDGNRVKASLGWQATETLTLTTDVDFGKDDYKTARYGLQSAKTTNWNLDATWTPNDNTSLSVFYSFEDQQQRFAGNTYTANSAVTSVNTATAVQGGCYATIALRNANNKIDACEDWTANNRDRTDTVGASLTKKGLLGGKLDLRGGLTYSNGRTDINVIGGNYANNPYAGLTSAASGTVAAYYIAATALPTVTVKTIEFQLAGTVHLGKDSALQATYGYKRLSVTDWVYDTMAFGSLSGVVPTNEKAPHFGVSTFGLAVSTSFR